MNTRLANPYVVGTPVPGGQSFFGREDVFQLVQDTLGVPTQNMIVLYGQRRIGKTSLLHRLVTRLSGSFHAVLFDLQGKGQHDLPTLLSDLSAAIARSLDRPVPEPSTFVSGPDVFSEIFLPEVYAALGPRRLLILFDEFDVLGDEPSSSDDLAGNQLFDYLQNLIGREPRLACIFVIGRRVDELPIQYRALFKQAVFHRLSVLPRREAIELIARPAAGALQYAPEAIDAILDLTAGHPYLTQLLCYVIFRRLAAAGRVTATAEDVAACLDEALEIGAGGLDWFWEGLPRAERIMLSALAETLRPGLLGSDPAAAGGSNGNSRPVSSEEELLRTLSRHRVRLLDVELTSARQRLIEWEIVAHEDDGYRFVIDLVGRWIAREHPLDRAQHDIDVISQRATRYFNNARDAHLAGDLALAIEDYRRALAANPHHFGARLGLAQSLQESHDAPAAIVEYEKAYLIEPSSARDGLVSARLALGAACQERGDLEAAVDEFERVLRLAPSDDEAQNRLVAIWIQRGEAQMAGADDAAAVSAFARALAITPDDTSVRSRIKDIVRRRSESAEARGAWESAFKSLALLAEHLPDDKQLQMWLGDTRSKWRAHNYYELAVRAQSVGDRLTATEECRHALGANPHHAEARLLLAALLHEAGDLTGAVEEYELAYRLDAASAALGLAQARLQRAVELESQGDWVAAVVDYERALEAQPNADTARRRLPGIYVRWGDDHLAAGRFDDAVASFRKALLIAIQPQTLARPIKAKLAEYSQGQRAAGNWDAAVAAIARLRSDLMLRDRESDGWLVDVWMQRGEAILSAGRYKDAASTFRQTLQVAADASDAASVLARIKSTFFTHAEALLQAGQPDTAITALMTLIEVFGGDAETFAGLARAWSVRGDQDLAHDRLDEAEHAFQRALELQPSNPDVVARLTAVAQRRAYFDTERLRVEAAAHAARKDWIEAERLYRRLVVDLRDEASHSAYASVSEEIRLEELYALAQSCHSHGKWDAAIPVWIEICHSRGDYAGRGGPKAALLLAEAIERSAGIAQANERALARLQRRARVAWIAAGLFAAFALGELIYALAAGLLRIPGLTP